MLNKIIFSFILIVLVGLTTDTIAQKRRYGYNKSKYINKYKATAKSKTKKYSKFKGSKYKKKHYNKPQGIWTAGFSLNTMNYTGDLSPAEGRLSTDYRLTKVGVGISVSRSLIFGIFARFAYNIGKIEGNDIAAKNPDLKENPSGYGRYCRNLQFENVLHEFSIGFELDLFTNNHNTKWRIPITPYIFLGVAGIFHAPKAIAPATDQAGNVLAEAGTMVDLRSLGTEGQNIESVGLTPYSKIAVAIPIGIGVKYKLANNIDFNFELGFRPTFTDYLDDVSGKYVDLELFDDAPNSNLARALSERGGESYNEQVGKERDKNIYSANKIGEYYTGSEYVAGGIRGGLGNDWYVVSQFRFVYVVGRKRVIRKAKFR